MKTIEQKAKAYDEALERARNYHKQLLDEDNPEWAGDIEKIFPELHESEDERTRNEIIAFVEQSIHRGGGTPISQEQEDKCIAWLEKQGYKSQGETALEVWKDMRLEVYQQASGNRHEPNYSDDTTKMFSLNDIDEIIEKISEQKVSYTTLVETGNGGINALVTRELSTNSCDGAILTSLYNDLKKLKE